MICENWGSHRWKTAVSLDVTLEANEHFEETCYIITTQNMVAAGSPKTSVISYHTTWHYLSEDSNVNGRVH